MAPPAILQPLARALACHPGVHLAILFGSHARGAARADSDVDVAVIASGVDRFELAAAIGRALGCEVDVVPLDEPSIPLLEQLVAHGIVAYEAKRGAGALWHSRALAQLETDRPWYARMRDAWLERVAREGLPRW
jgi:predicted nucleotidyltransferase